MWPNRIIFLKRINQFQIKLGVSHSIKNKFLFLWIMTRKWYPYNGELNVGEHLYTYLVNVICGWCEPWLNRIMFLKRTKLFKIKGVPHYIYKKKTTVFMDNDLKMVLLWPTWYGRITLHVFSNCYLWLVWIVIQPNAIS